MSDYLKSYDNIFKKRCKYLKTEVNLCSVPWTRTLFPLSLNDVLENVLVCKQFSSNYPMVPKVYALSRSHLYFWDTRLFPIFMPKMSTGGFTHPLQKYGSTITNVTTS